MKADDSLETTDKVSQHSIRFSFVVFPHTIRDAASALASFILCVVGLLDMLAFFVSNDDVDEEDQQSSIGTTTTSPDRFQELASHQGRIDFVFCLLWLLESFHFARIIMMRTYEMNERIELGLTDSKKSTRRSPILVYLVFVVCRALLLPIAFYSSIYATFHRKASKSGVDETPIVTELDEKGGYSSESDLRSVAFVMLLDLWLLTKTATTELIRRKIRDVLRSVGPWLTKKLTFAALKNPRKYRRRFRKLMTTARWTKYLGPLVGTTNKLKGQIFDGLKRWRQHQEAKAYRRFKKTVSVEKSREQVMNDAALTLQAAYRGYRARKATRALKLFCANKEHLAAVKLQMIMRRKLRRQREKIRLRKAELASLEKRSRYLSDTERKRLYVLHDSFVLETRELLNKKLLIRPNSRFSFLWKSLMILCVALDIIRIGMKSNPFTSKILDGRCPCPNNVSRSIVERNERSPGNLRQLSTDMFALVFESEAVSEWPECIPPKPRRFFLLGHVLRRKDTCMSCKPWYCADFVMTSHLYYLSLSTFLSWAVPLLTTTVYCLDVFINFFTGELDVVTGSLAPKNFVSRWIVPGLLLQIMINPSLGGLTRVLSELVAAMERLGPARVLMWFISSVYPIYRAIWAFAAEIVWFREEAMFM